MLRKFRIKTRLLLSFFIIVFFTFIVGLTSFVSLTSIGNMAVKTIHNVRTLNDIYDYCAAVDSGITSMMYIVDDTLSHNVVQTTKNTTEELLTEMDKYLEIQEQFSDVFSPGEMQDMVNALAVYKETYVPIINEIFDLIDQGRREEALPVSINRLTPLYNSILFSINAAFIKNLEYSEIVTAKSSERASFNSYLMLAVVLLSLIVSVLLALAVTKSIAVPLSGLEKSAEKIANGELDVQFEVSQSNDEISWLSQRLDETLQRLSQAQSIKLIAIEAQHEKEKAEAASKSKGEFLAKMSHEIRTPMNAITGMAELALREDMTDAAREHILTIKQAGMNLLSIINDILDFSKIESGKLEIVPAGYLFSSLINDVISIIRMKVINSQLRFVVNIDSNIPNVLFGDEIRIRQILLNILSNAVKFTEKGYVSFSVEGAIRDEDTVDLAINVTDSGRGMKQEDIEKLFEEFVQIDLTGNRGIEGTGLGLAITRSLVNAMDGDISVNSEYGRGSTFIITFPQKIYENEKLASVHEPGKKRVLVYELRKLYADSLIYAVENLGVECTLVSTDLEFREEIAAKSYSFIFIPPRLYETVKDICSNSGAGIKIVLLAGFGEVYTNKDLSTLTMPVYSIPVANILNGVTTSSTFNADKKSVIRFFAPDAKVLVVDDIDTNLKVAEGLLQPYKIQVEMCKNGREAIELIKNKHYDLVFMDHMMPEMDGVEATMIIRALKGFRFDVIPIIALTANVVSGMKEMFMEKGFNDLLAKPIDISKLNEILVRWIPKEKRKWGMENMNSENNEEQGNSAGSPGSRFVPGIPGVDTAKGLAMTGGKAEGYYQVLSIFCKDVQERLQLLRFFLFESMNKSKFPEKHLSSFTTQVHALKSASASLGALDLPAEAGRLEDAGKNGELTFIWENLSGFIDHLTELAENIRSALENQPEGSRSKPEEPKYEEKTDSLSVNMPLFNELAEALKSQNISSIDRILDELNEKQLDSKCKEILEHVSDQVLMTEFEDAVKTIIELINTKN